MAKISELFDVATAHFRAGRMADAEEICQRILEVDPTVADAWLLRGMIKCRGSDYQTSVEHLSRAIQLDPSSTNAHFILGVAFDKQNKLAEAIASFQRARHLNPAFAEIHNALGSAYVRSGMFDEAVEYLTHALKIEPDCVEASYNLAVAFERLGVNTEAIQHFQQTIALAPDHFEAIVNLAAAYQEELRLDEAASYYERALLIKSDSPEARCNYAVLKLLKGDFVKGWPEYEYRWQVGKLRKREFRQPMWNGEPLDGRTILLYAEQGLGDTMQFVRFAPIVRTHGGRVVVECQPPLKNLLARTPGIDQLLAGGEAISEFDVRAPLLSLPGIFGTRLETIPADIPYIHAAPDLVVQWQRALAQVRGLRIGINWHGRVGLREAAVRDIPLGLFAALAKVPNVSLISLQKTDNDLAVRNQLTQMGILELGEIDSVNGAFMDTAAVMKNLDLVITSDTAIAHLAGGLGVPVWVGLPFVPDWRWLLDRSDSPWYPTMRLFRQKSAGDWASVFQQMEDSLQERLGTF